MLLYKRSLCSILIQLIRRVAQWANEMNGHIGMLRAVMSKHEQVFVSA